MNPIPSPLSDIVRVHQIGAGLSRTLTPDADVRGRIVYFTQIGYATLDQRESWETRNARGRHYLFCMTGQAPSDSELALLTVMGR